MPDDAIAFSQACDGIDSMIFMMEKIDLKESEKYFFEKEIAIIKSSYKLFKDSNGKLESREITDMIYNDLAEEGFIISMVGKGYFVAPRELLRERMLYEMEKGLEKAVTNGRNAGFSDEEIVEALSKIQKTPKNN